MKDSGLGAGSSSGKNRLMHTQCSHGIAVQHGPVSPPRLEPSRMKAPRLESSGMEAPRPEPPRMEPPRLEPPRLDYS